MKINWIELNCSEIEWDWLKRPLWRPTERRRWCRRCHPRNRCSYLPLSISQRIAGPRTSLLQKKKTKCHILVSKDLNILVITSSSKNYQCRHPGLDTIACRFRKHRSRCVCIDVRSKELTRFSQSRTSSGDEDNKTIQDNNWDQFAPVESFWFILCVMSFGENTRGLK